MFDVRMTSEWMTWISALAAPLQARSRFRLAPLFLGMTFAAGRRTASFRVDVGDAVRVGRRSESENLAVDVSAAAFGVFVFLEHDHAGALAQHEAVSQTVERPRRLRRLVVAGR